MEYCDLLDKADQCEDPYMRLVYACECAHPSSSLRGFCKYKHIVNGVKFSYGSIMGHICILCLPENLEAF